MNIRIRALREDNDFKQKDIATFLIMSQTGYSKYETGENDISLDRLIQLSYFYDVSIEYLIGTSEVKDLPKPSPDELERYIMYRTAFLDLKKKQADR